MSRIIEFKKKEETDAAVVKTVRSALLFESLKDILENGQTVKMTVTGNSMAPFMLEGRDSVELSKTNFESIKIDDMVLIQRVDGYYVMHRVIRKEADCFYMVGDAQTDIEGPLFPEQLRAKIIAVYHKQKRIDVDDKTYRALVFLWRLCLPIRRPILKQMRGVYRWLKTIKTN